MARLQRLSSARRWLARATALCLFSLWGAGSSTRARAACPSQRTPAASTLFARAQSVFQVVRRSVARRPRAQRMELMLERSSGRRPPGAYTTPQGCIVVNRALLRLAQRKGSLEHILAFVLGHELAHGDRDDLWHFYRLATPADRQAAVWEKGRFEKEMRADVLGAMYATIAGYDMDAVLESGFIEALMRANGIHLGSRDYKSAEARTQDLSAWIRKARGYAAMLRFARYMTLRGDHDVAMAALNVIVREYEAPEILAWRGLLHFRTAKLLLDRAATEGEPLSWPNILTGEERHQLGRGVPLPSCEPIVPGQSRFEEALRVRPWGGARGQAEDLLDEGRRRMAWARADFEAATKAAPTPALWISLACAQAYLGTKYDLQNALTSAERALDSAQASPLKDLIALNRGVIRNMVQAAERGRLRSSQWSRGKAQSRPEPYAAKLNRARLEAALGRTPYRDPSVAWNGQEVRRTKSVLRRAQMVARRAKWRTALKLPGQQAPESVGFILEKDLLLGADRYTWRWGTKGRRVQIIVLPWPPNAQEPDSMPKGVAGLWTYFSDGRRAFANRAQDNSGPAVLGVKEIKQIVLDAKAVR